MTTAEAVTLPTLYKKATTGAIQEWTISVTPVFEDEAPFVGDGIYGDITTVYGQVDGAKTTTTDRVTVGKNVGRANETTALEQAALEAQAKWEKKLKNGGYVRTREEAEAGQQDADFVAGGVKPMLAHDFGKRGHDIAFPALVQPKLDGHRCVAVIRDGACTLWSRNQKPITSMVHVQRALEAQFPGETITLDGELYLHDESFQKLSSLIRKSTPQPGAERIQLWVYDVVSDEPQADRIAQVREIPTIHPLVSVPTDEVEDQEEMVAVFGGYLANNYEGLMVRNVNGRYKNARSADLQKVKVFDDAEYEVVGVNEGRGNMAGKAIFVCALPNGDTFTVKMKGALESLRQYVEDPSLAVGRQLTVQFQGLSDDGVPRFPVGLRFREEI